VSFVYATEPGLTPHEFIDILRRSTLAERRPVNEPATIAGMLTHADIILTARAQSGLLVGVSRAITDYHYCTYLSDLAVDYDYQRQGIGQELIRLTHETAGLGTRLIYFPLPPHRTITLTSACADTTRAGQSILSGMLHRLTVRPLTTPYALPKLNSSP